MHGGGKDNAKALTTAENMHMFPVSMLFAEKNLCGAPLKRA